MNPIIVLGSGLAGYTVVRELRKLNRDIPITLVTRDNGDYYSKPMLSNAFAQNKDAASLVLTKAADMAKQLDIGLLVDTDVHAIHRGSKRLDTTSGMLEYDKLVLALGADPIRIPLQGDAVDEVLSVNDLKDYAKLRVALGASKSIAIMGGGLIGCEFANDLATAGYTVSVIDPGAYPLASLMPEQAGKQLLEPLSKIGVTWRFGTSVQSVNKADAGYALTLADGSSMQADLVLSAVGLRPRTQLARDAGITVNRGIVVNERLCTSDASIHALGDCAEIEGKVLPFVLPIMHAGRTLARILNGEDAKVVFPAMPVVVKTPAHPVAVSPVARDAVGAWQEMATGQGVKMEFVDALNKLSGFVLTGEYAGERNEMAKRLAV
ncbi:rubredoxin-NAD(+) reductase [mine drainage metagenome]|uniref:Rubredoxin-NAD(+) reductase n=1 Tax=mine drainage metagenome TaxID=410659 RepID=A0A1J5SIA1_9ZZZZ